jgi:hypothetical protein
MAQMTYAAFITWLLSFKDELPAILADIEAAVSALMSAYERIKGTLPAASVELNDEELKLETDLAVAMAGPNAAWDGSKLRALFKFAQDSGLLPIIISLLTK